MSRRLTCSRYYNIIITSMTKIAIVQLNPIPGDFDKSGAKILDAFNKIPNLDSWTEDDWIVFPFGALSGYPLEDLRFNAGFVRA